MKKIVLFLTFFVVLFANNNYKLYEHYVNRILHYSFELKIPIYNPFYIESIHKSIVNNVKIKNSELKLKVSVVLNNKILLSYMIMPKKVQKAKEEAKGVIEKIKHFVKKDEKKEIKPKKEIWIKKWVKVGDTIEGYKIIQIDKGVVLLKHNNKIEKVVYDKINKKINIKVLR